MVKKQGVLTGIGHGFGIYFYVALVVTGFSVALAAAPKLELYVSYTGVALLIWLGFPSCVVTRKRFLNWRPPAMEVS